MSENDTNDTATDHSASNISEPALTETEREAPETLPVTVAVVDPMSAMQSALASFDGLRVDAAIQVVEKLIPFPYTYTYNL